MSDETLGKLLIAFIAALPATIAAIGTLLVSLRGLVKIEQVHKATNSKMDKLLAVTETAARAEGKIEGKAEEQAGRASSAGTP